MDSARKSKAPKPAPGFVSGLVRLLETHFSDIDYNAFANELARAGMLELVEVSRRNLSLKCRVIATFTAIHMRYQDLAFRKEILMQFALIQYVLQLKQGACDSVEGVSLSAFKATPRSLQRQSELIGALLVYLEGK